jgi:putative iron-regulated protein
MKNRLTTIVIATMFFAGCHKADAPTPSSDFTTTEQTVLNSFTNNTALPQYSNLVSAAVALNSSIQTLNATTTDANLVSAQASWKNIRGIWEQCEGFLVGPVEDNDYDPNTDTWPTDYTQMDSLLASSNALQLSDVEMLPQTLRGYHPIEYLIFGIGGTKKASEITARQKQYLVSLSGDILYNNVQELYQSWAAAPTNYAQQITTAGNGSTIYSTRRDVFLAILGAMSDICNEVGAEKMYDPYFAKDSFLTESPYSGNTLIDFKSNIIGVRNVYFGLNGNVGIKDLIAAKNKSLDNEVQFQLTSAINSFDNITERYEEAIFTQRVQIQQTMQQLATLKSLLDDDVTNFITQNVQD